MLFLSPILFCGYTCEMSGAAPSGPKDAVVTASDSLDPNAKTLFQRFAPPSGYTRMAADEHSFGAYLRELPLKPPGSKVLYYTGAEKENFGIYEAWSIYPSATKTSRFGNAAVGFYGG